MTENNSLVGDFGGKIRARESRDSLLLSGYIDACQQMFLPGDPELSLTLEATLLDLFGPVSDAEVVRFVYMDAMEVTHKEVPVDEMIARINSVLTISRKYWKESYFGIAGFSETTLRERFWQKLARCIDYHAARIVDVGEDVPWVNIGGNGCTYILYSQENKMCLLLVANYSD